MSSVTKEEMAARLRSVLGVDVRFEKLSKDEIAVLLAKVSELKAAATAQQTQTTQRPMEGYFPFGIIPTLFERASAVIPVIREEIRKRTDELIDEMIGTTGGVIGTGKRKKGEGGSS
ncbi:MAG: hypothetical protein QXP93_05345 [Nitrososphaerota archaeon]